MDDLLDIYRKCEVFDEKLERMKNDCITKIKAIFWDPTAASGAGIANSSEVDPCVTSASLVLPTPSPKQSKKRAKRLSSLQENDEQLQTSVRTSNSQLLATISAVKEDAIKMETSFETGGPPETDITEPIAVQQKTDAEQMPPPSVPVASINSEIVKEDHSFARPQRAAKLKSEKNLKEPKLNKKLRRPSNLDSSVKVKLESEQRHSQMIDKNECSADNSQKSTISEDAVEILPESSPPLVEISEDEHQASSDKVKEIDNEDNNSVKGARQLRVNIKREKISLTIAESTVTQETTIDTVVAKTITTVPLPKELPITKHEICNESTMASSIMSTTSSTTVATKKTRKKKDMAVPIPIKVERFSELDAVNLPISSRTRKGSNGLEQQKQDEHKEQKEQQNKPEKQCANTSVYEDAVDSLPESVNKKSSNTKATQKPTEVTRILSNETITLNTIGSEKKNKTMVVSPNDETFCTNPAQSTFHVAPGQTTFIMDNNNLNATVTLKKMSDTDKGDATFNVPVAQTDAKHSMASTHLSMETAKDSSHPENDTINNESPTVRDELPKPKMPIIPKVQSMSKITNSGKAYKMPTRTNELFNPLVQSPVKKKVEAFENAANAATTEVKNLRSKRLKENAAASATTPVIGKLQGPALGRFLTPTQMSNITPNLMVTQAKKLPNSASKAMPFPKAATNLKNTTSSSSSKTLSRENSAESSDFRKGLNQLVEERKRQREQKHLLAAQQREAKERERLERMAKANKEREEKRLKKQMEAEKRKRELEEIQRKIRHQEEAEAAAAEAAKQKALAKAKVEQERELLMQMKQQQQQQQQQQQKQQQNMANTKHKMAAPAPKQQSSKYTFEMLHEDDSTDDERKISYKRPPPPTWSLSHMRGASINMQQHFPTSIIDSFFSVQPLTPDLKLIFPNIDARFLKRNSSVMWGTPPRYSELPKY